MAMAALEAKFPGRPAVQGMEHCKALGDLLYARWMCKVTVGIL